MARHVRIAKDPRDSKRWRAFRLTILARDNYTCAYCGKDATTVDHVMPIIDHPDQAFNPENCVSACQPCNSAKGSRSQGVFLGRRFTPPVFPDLSLPEMVVSVPESPFEKP